MGITGNVIKGAYGVLNKLGIGSFMNLAAVTQKMQLAAQDGAGKIKILGIGMKAAFTAIGDALTDPVAMLTGVVKLLKFIYDSAVGYQSKMFQAGKDLGLNVTESTKLFKNFQSIAAANGSLANSFSLAIVCCVSENSCIISPTLGPLRTPCSKRESIKPNCSRLYS